MAERHLADSKIARHIAVTTHDFSSLAPLVAMPVLRLCMQWHDWQTPDPAHRWLREQLAAVAAEG